jgi:NADPH-dependent ferric siderophore reductase
MPRKGPRKLKVIGTKRITANMHRVTLGGVEMLDFPDNQEGGYVKLNFPQRNNERIITRTYSVRFQRENEIDIDFALHGDGGPASRWAVECEEGEPILITGPGPKTLVDHQANWFLFVGDMTALPAISVNIEQLPAEAIGYVVIEVIDEADIQPLPTLAGLKVKWLVNPKPGENAELLNKYVRSLTWLDGHPSVWVACEFNSMRNLRDYLRTERRLSRDSLYISSYWKHGGNEDLHRDAKREDAKALVSLV